MEDTAGIGINTLKGDPKNPRKISPEQFAKLKETLKKFGDLSGIVKNLETDELVGGHMRLEAFKADPNAAANIQIIQRFEQPTEAGTVAIGSVVVNGEPYAYREVRWTRPFQRAANVAANHAGGEDDVDLLAEVIYELSQEANSAELLDLTTLQETDLSKLLAMVSGEPEIDLPEGDRAGFTQMTFTLSDEQAEIVNQAIAFMKQNKSFEGLENENGNGNALYFVAREFLDYTNGNKE